MPEIKRVRHKRLNFLSVAHALSELVGYILADSEHRLASWRDKLSRDLGGNGRIILNLVPEMALFIGEQPPVAPLGLDETSPSGLVIGALHFTTG